MPYNEVKGKTIDEYRKIFHEIYCSPSESVKTFDGIKVKFYDDNFNHAFYESENWQKGDKSKFSINRADKILWIKDTLEDKTAKLKVGWVSETKSYNHSRRVAVVKDNYVVIIYIKNSIEAKFITAYEADKSIAKILSCPDWK